MIQENTIYIPVVSAAGTTTQAIDRYSPLGRIIMKNGLYFLEHRDCDMFLNIALTVSEAFREKKGKYTHIGLEFFRKDARNPVRRVFKKKANK